MKSTRRLTSLMFTSLLALGLTACQRSSTPPVDLPQELLDVLPIGEKRDVEVVLASPKGELNQLDQSQAIVIGFNQPMVPLRPVSTDLDVDFVEMTPKLEGRFRWKGTATLVFEPKVALPYATKFNVKVKPGVESLSKQKLAKEFSFDFTTPTVGLSHSLPLSGSEMQGVSEPIYLHFNQPVQLEGLQSALELVQKKPSGGTQVTGVEVRAYTEEDRKAESAAGLLQDAYDLPRENGSVQGKAEHAVVVTPKQALLPGVPTTLLLKSGIKSPAGPVATTQERKLEFTTRREFALDPGAVTTLDPEQGLSLAFTSQVSPVKLRQALTIEPKIELPDYSDEGDYTTYNPYLGGELKPNTTYKIQISDALQDRFGAKITGPREVTVKTTDYSPMLLGPEGSGVLELQGAQKIPYGVRNLSRLQARYRKLTPAEVISIHKAEGALYSGRPYSPPGGFTQSLELGGSKRRNEMEERRLALPGGGLYYVQVEEGESRSQRSLVAVSEVGVTVKSSGEQLLVFATTLQDAKPVDGCQIEVYDDKGKRLWSGKTDAEGFCQAPGWAELKVDKPDEWGAPGLWVFASKGKSQTYLNTSSYQSVGPWAFDIDYESNQFARRFQAFAFSERGVYKPGETVQLKGSLREIVQGSWKLPELDRVVYKVVDSRDREVSKGELEINRFGAFDQSLALKKDAATGMYRVEYSLPKALEKTLKWSRELATVSFQVEAFKPAQFEVTVKAGESHYVMGDKAKVEFKGWYLFGAPMNDRPLEWVARLEPALLRPDGYEGYDFGLDFDGDKKDEAKILASGNQTLDAQGLNQQTVNLEGIPYLGSAQLVIEGTSTSPNRQRISGRQVVPLHRGEVQLGLRPASFFGNAGKAHKFEAVAVRPDGQTQQGVEVKLELLRRQWNSVRKADVSGGYTWVSEVKDEKVSDQTLRTSTEPAQFEVTPEKAGYYIVRASSKDKRGNTVVTESGFYASGSDYVAWSRNEQDIVDLVPDKKTYKPGDVATIMVKSPYENCRALITLERDHVMDRRVVELQGTAATIEVPLTSRHLPNVYVSVMLLRGREAKQEFGPDGQDLSKPSFKLGYTNLLVEPSEKKLEVKIKLDKEQYAPGEEVVADFEIVDQGSKPVEAELTVGVPDQGVLALTGYQLPDWFSYFYGPRPMAIMTCENRMDIIGQRAYGAKGANAGGGGGFDAEAVRENFRYTAYWNPSLVTDAQGKAQARFKLPDNTTTFRLMALAQTRNSEFGAAESKFEVQKPLLMQPSTPTLARLGDSFQAGVVVRNNSKESLSVKVSAEPEGVKLTGEGSKTITLGGGKEQEVLFAMEADKLGDGKLKFSAQGGQFDDALAVPLSVRQSLVLENVSTSGSTQESATLEMVIPSPMLVGTGVLRMWLSSTALVGLEGPLEQIFDTHFMGLETQLSKIRAAVALQSMKDVLSGSFGEQPVASWIEGLRSYAVNEKGFAVFREWSRPDAYLTAYALETLYAARQSQFKVDPKLIDIARAYLKDFLNHPEENASRLSPEELRTVRCFALYALSLDDFDGLSYFNNLMRSRLDLGLEARIYLLLAGRNLGASQQDLEVLQQDILNAAKVEAATVYFQDSAKNPGRWTFASQNKLTALALKALLGAKKPDPRTGKIVAWLMEARSADGSWGNTHDDARVLEALELYYRTQEEKVPDFAVTAFLQKDTIQKAEFKGRKSKVEKSTTPVKAGSEKLAVGIKKDGSGRLYYQMRLSYAPEKEAPARDEGLVVLKKISTLDGTRFPAELKAGETYKVTLTVVSPQDRRFVVVSDPIPAGCEIVQTQFETESAEMSRILAAAQSKLGEATFAHFEKYADRVDLFADGLQAGEHTFQYLIRANQPGKYRMPATKAEEMYHPEIFGTTLAREVTIR